MYSDYSVLMSVYSKDNPEWLNTSIESIMNQTVLPSEVVIIEDGPIPDELNNVIIKFTNLYDRLFKIIKLEKNYGLGLALNKGIKYCSNELIARMDSDDYSVPERCEKLLKKFQNNPQLDVVGSYEVEFENDIRCQFSIHKVPETSEEIYNYMKRRCALLHPTVMYKKSAVLNAGNYQNVPQYEDYDLFMRMIVKCKCTAYNIQENLYYIRINEDFFKRRGGLSYLKTAVEFKYKQFREKNISFIDFIISAGGQGIVCLMPNKMRRWFYMHFLR